MSAVLQHLNTIATVYMTSIFNTGNRMLDNSLVAILAIFLGHIATHFAEHWKEVYNMCIYHIYGMAAHPLELLRAPYIIPREFDMDLDAFVEFMSVEDLSEYDCKPEKVAAYITELINTNNQPRITGKNGNTYIQDYTNDTNKDLYPGFYPILVMSNGMCVYYCSRTHQIYTRTHSTDAIRIFTNYLELCYKADPKQSINENNSIFQPTTERETRMTMNTIGKISAKKTFDSLFYEDKAALIGLLQRFKTGTMYPSHIPMDNKLGILLYGPSWNWEDWNHLGNCKYARTKSCSCELYANYNL
jgi:hypothetical protein